MSGGSQTSFNSLYKGKYCLIHHDSVVKAAWDWLILAFVIYTAIVIPYDVAFVTPRRTKMHTSRFGDLVNFSPIAIGNLIIDLLFIIDIPINFRSAVVDKRTEEVISDSKKIAMLYLKSWFWVDFVAAIPFEFLVDPQHEGATTLMGLLKTARLLRLVRVSRKIDRYSEYGLAVIVLLTCLFTLTAHWLACVWHAIGIVEARDDSGWLSYLAGEISKPINQSNPTSGPSLNTRYITSLYFTLSSLTSVGFGNIAPSTDSEKVFAIIVMIIGALMYASIFGNLTVIIQRLYLQSSRQKEELLLIREFVNFYKIPRALKENLENHILHESHFLKAGDLQAVLNMFPSTLQTDICLHIHDELFRENPVFRAVVPSCKRLLATKLQVQHFLPRQYVIKQGDEVDKVFFIVKGIVHVVVDGETLIALGRGDIIYCEFKSPYSKPRATASLTVQTNTHIHYIEWSDLLTIFEKFPMFREDFMNRRVFSYQIGDYVKEDDDLEVTETSPRAGLEPRTKLANSAEKTQASSLDLALSSVDLKVLEDRMKLIDKRLSNLESEISLVIPFLRKTLKAED
ncbi:voltage-gated inwardly rectifying potassium channel KCNH6-like [Porites lutea]|uniref:voltage-gated inwardly rectifying potassium channel KCNH6-like n=1 Tax=Porites lutea TaxID=51062 RepID=UPI003CC507E9